MALDFLQPADRSEMPKWERKQILRRVEDCSEQEFEKAADIARLNTTERDAMTHWRNSAQVLDTSKRAQAINQLYTAAKSPILHKIETELNIGPGSSIKQAVQESQAYEKLQEEEKGFTHGDFESAIEKLRGLL